MTSAEIALAAFALCNTIRIVAYLPQIVAIARDTHGASAISYTTWLLFTASHLSTVGYAIYAIEDWRMAALFAVNTGCCVAIIVLTAARRARFRRSLPRAEAGQPAMHPVCSAAVVFRAKRFQLLRARVASAPSAATGTNIHQHAQLQRS